MHDDRFSDYMARCRNAARPHTHDETGLYYGVEGAKRLGREVGPALLDFPDGAKNIGSTYSGICVIAYGLKPPIDAKTWLDAVREGMEKAAKYNEAMK